MNPNEGHPAPAPPADALWRAAIADYEAGRVMRLEVSNAHADVAVHCTLTWLDQWRRLPLSVSARHAIRTAASQIHRDIVHPCLGKRTMPDADGYWMASPYDAITITWCAHWSEPTVPVLLTLDSSSS